MIRRNIFLFFLLICQMAGAQNTDMDHLFGYFKNAAKFDYQFPREKVYLHLDNNAYFEDETIWFKAYVVRASSLQPSTLSRVLYVELLKDDGSLIERKLFRIDSLGQADGSFKLELPIKSGFHEIRAYTREMVNWGEEACFSRVIPVFQKHTKQRKKAMKLEDINSDALDIIYPEDDKRNAHLQPSEAKKMQLHFFPEGGNRTAGVPQRIAYQLTDGRGARLTDTLQIFRPNGTLLTTTECEHEGMGTFNLPADFGNGGYVTVRNTRFDLPDIEPLQKYAIQTVSEEDGVTVYVSPAPSAEPELLGLAIHCRDKMCYLDTLTLNQEPLGLFVPYSALHGGVNHLELINTKGESLCRRLIWKKSPERKLNLKIRQNRQVYPAFSPVALEMDLKDENGTPVSTTFSLSVRDDDGELIRNNTASTYADMLLSSELKGYIHQPDFYFEKEDAAHLRALDLLLMVQGWSANTFETLCGQTPFQFQQPIEENLTLNGFAYKFNNKKEPYPNLDLKIKMYSRSGASLEGEAVTDQEGAFAFVSNVDYVGDWIAQINTNDPSGKKEWSCIAFDRWFSPELRPLDFMETQLEAPLPRLYAEGDQQQEDLFTWKDTISDESTLLGTAVIKGKKKYKGFTGNRYTYNGGENAGMRNGDEFYNIEVELERYKDKGMAPTTLEAFLGMLSDDFLQNDNVEASDNFLEQGATETAENKSNINVGIVNNGNERELNGKPNDHTDDGAYITYKGEPIQVFVNNAPSNGLKLKPEEIKSVAVVHNASRIRHMVSNNDFDLNQKNKDMPVNDHALFIYELPDAYLFRTKKGVEKRRIWGYAPITKFYNPNYRETDLPSDKDIRRTLYWNPSVTTDKDGKTSVIFFTNCREEVEIRISARGVTPDGRMLDAEK